MAAKTWETDFRYPAIRASIKIVREKRADDIFDCPASLCIPVSNKPVVGWTPGKIFIVFLVLGFALLIGSVFVVGKAERDTKRGQGDDPMLLAVGAALGLSGMACFFVPSLADRLIMKLLTGSRGRDLLHRDGKVHCAEISHTDRSKMKIEIDGDDYVLLLADQANRRLLLEGVAARYQIRAEDMIQLKPFQFLNYVGAEMEFRIDETTSLSLAVARVSLLLELTRQLPFLYFLRKRIKNRILTSCAEALGRSSDVDETI